MARVISSRIRGMLTLLGALVLMASAGLCAPQSSIALSQRRAYASDHVIVKLKPGRPMGDLSWFASRLNAKVRNRRIGESSYIVDLPKGATSTQVIAKSLALLSSHQSISAITYDYIRYPLATGPDPFYPDQWALQPASHIYAPEAWGYLQATDPQRPIREVVVAVIDTGVRDRSQVNPDKPLEIVRIPHPDLDRVLLKGQGYDFGDLDSDPSPTEFSGVIDGSWGHGTHVAGIIAAQINNAIGIAGAAPNFAPDNAQSQVKVWILPLKVADYHGVMYDSAIINALGYCASATLTSPATGKPLSVNVVNLSVGGIYADGQLQQAIRNLTQGDPATGRKGMVVVAASGNDGAGQVLFPAAFPECIAVGASTINDGVASFSDFGPELDLIAPGENIPSTVWQPDYAVFKFKDITATNGGGGAPQIPGAANPLALAPERPYAQDTYGNAIVSWSGTSMAAPHVAAAAALLISTGVPPEEVQQYLVENATPSANNDPRAANGLLNLDESLQKSTINMQIVAPAFGGISASRKTSFRVKFRFADPNSISAWIDGLQVEVRPGYSHPDITNWNYTVQDNQRPELRRSTLSFDYVVGGSARDHTFKVVVDSAFVPPSPYSTARRTEIVNFAVEMPRITKGWNLFSIPYFYPAPRTPEQALNTSAAMLFRWSYAASASGQYAKYVLGAAGSPKEAEATFDPPSMHGPDSVLMPLGAPGITAPAGLGYWLRMEDPNGLPVPDTFGSNVDAAPYEIQVNFGWNLVGDPFIFPVSWDNIIIEYNGVRLTAAEAAAMVWNNDSVFSWDKVLNQGLGDYVRRPVSNGIMIPWEAQWIKVRLKGARTWPVPDMKLIVPPNPFGGLLP